MTAIDYFLFELASVCATALGIEVALSFFGDNG